MPYPRNPPADRAPGCPARPPGRREERRQTRREAMLAVAARSFLEQGYAGTTMTAIAAALGGSKGTLWGYFPSKEALFEAVVDRATDSFRRQLLLVLTPDGAVGDTLLRFCEAFMARIAHPEILALHRLVLGETGRFPEVGRIFHARGIQLTQRLLADFMAEAMARGQLRAADPLLAAQQLIGMCLAGRYQWLLLGIASAGDAEATRADIAAAVPTFLRAYAP